MDAFETTCSWDEADALTVCPYLKNGHVAEFFVHRGELGRPSVVLNMAAAKAFRAWLDAAILATEAAQ